MAMVVIEPMDVESEKFREMRRWLWTNWRRITVYRVNGETPETFPMEQDTSMVSPSPSFLKVRNGIVSIQSHKLHVHMVDEEEAVMFKLRFG